MSGNTLMIQGTSSSAGKSLLVTAICRVFARRGLRVAPFKAQNMSNNAAVCADGSEIGRSQALQAMAASTDPHPDMNPILLKPEGDSRSQVIVNGRPLQSLKAADYYKRKEQFWNIVTEALDRLRQQYDLVIIEGAGSPAELNLADIEIVNMAVARYCSSPVVLVGDIERGGVFAQLLGTLWLLPPEERKLIKGLVVNKFRGDLRLFDRGVELLESHGQVAVLGVLPWIDGLRLPEEDAAPLLHDAARDRGAAPLDEMQLDIAIVHLPHLSNFDDFDPLSNEPGVRVRYVRSVDQLGEPDVIVLPGTKNTLGDLNWLRMTGLADRIVKRSAHGTAVIGICGGYQMLGRELHNPDGMESDWHSAAGLGLLDVETTFFIEKRTYQVEVELIDDTIAPGMLRQKMTGYEIHTGHTTSRAPWIRQVRSVRRAADKNIPPHLTLSPTNLAAPGGGAGTIDSVARLSGSQEIVFDGAKSADGRTWGCYVHGLFHNDEFRRAWLRFLGVETSLSDAAIANHTIDVSLDRLADAVESHLDISQLVELISNKEHMKANV